MNKFAPFFLIVFLVSGFSSFSQYQFADRDELKTAVDAWIDDSVSTESTYGHISDWDVSKITDMFELFFLWENFKADLSNWDVSNVKDMSLMFLYTRNLDLNISDWDVSNVKKMTNMFQNAVSFNSDISKWNVSNVTDMSYMFHQVENFGSDVSNWGISNINISNWDVSNVTNMNKMFEESTFNGNISEWDVSNVTDMSGMFLDAPYFNSDISNWNISNVTNIYQMLRNTNSFSDENYNLLLEGWSKLNLTNNLFIRIPAKYCNGAARQYIIDNFAWTIIDEGQAPDSNCDQLLRTDLKYVTSGFTVSPNPCYSQINVDLNHSNQESGTIQIFDLYGQIVHSEDINSNSYSINTETFPQGRYTLKVILDSEILQKQFVKE